MIALMATFLFQFQAWKRAADRKRKNPLSH